MQIQKNIKFYTPSSNYKINNNNSGLLPGIVEETESGGCIRASTVRVSQKKKGEIRCYKLLNVIWFFSVYLLLLDPGDIG